MASNGNSLPDLISKANDTFVLLGQNPTADTIAAGLALYHTLESQGKNVFIACPTEINPEEVDLNGVEEIAHKIGNRNLVISLSVNSKDSIEKVSYHLEEDGKAFNLVIQPKKGNPPLKSNDVKYSYQGVQADLIIILGANRLEDLGSFYEAEKKVFSDATTVSFSRHPGVNFAQHKIVEPDTASLAEVVLKSMQSANLQLNQAAATCLLYGIDWSTQNLQSPNVTADTFEAVASLLRAGGQRQNQGRDDLAGPASFGRPPMMPPSNMAQGLGAGIPKDWLAPKIYTGSTPKDR
jgi:nanoRNase/pAp phosphatase (c-di-AMP/oligoRNAs hydrolase)